MLQRFDKDGFRDLPFFGLAGLLHGLLLLINPAINWGSAQAAVPVAAPLPIEFVKAPPPPPPTAQLAPVQPAGGAKAAAPPKGPGERKIEKRKAGSPKMRKAPPPAPAKRRLTPEQRAAAAKRAAERKARLVEARRQAAIQAEEARSRRLALAEERRQKRLEAQRRAAEEAAARAEEARRRAEEIRQRKLAEAAERARKRAEIEAELAAVPNPDEALSDAGAEAPRDALASAAPLPGGSRKAAPGYGAATAAADDDQDPGYDAEGQEGRHGANVRPAGGGLSSGGEGVNWSLEGPVGNRRLVVRRFPACPDWVSERGLDLTVRIRFQVLPDGTVKGTVIKSTSGFPEIDRLAVQALGRWRFEALPRGSGAVTWGMISFRFTMG